MDLFNQRKLKYLQNPNNVNKKALRYRVTKKNSEMAFTVTVISKFRSLVTSQPFYKLRIWFFLLKPIRKNR